jgi:hypothetical protein
MAGDEKSRLKTLLSYWVGHNEEHGREFREWAERAAQMGRKRWPGPVCRP